MNKRIVKFLAVISSLVMLIPLFGCGGQAHTVMETAAAGNFAAAKEAGYPYPMEAPAAEEAAYDEAGYVNGLSGNAAPSEYELSGSNVDAEGNAVKEDAEDHGRKLIRNVDVSLQTLEFDKVTEGIKANIKSYGGYIENSGVYGGSYYGSSRRSASITARIPQEKLDAFLETALAGATVISMNESTEDVTLRYTDLESKVKTLKIEYDTLNELLLKAENIETVIALEDRLSQVRYEMESINQSLKSYDNRVTYSTVYLNIEEVAIITPAKEATFGEKITGGFKEGTADFVEGVEDFIVWFISNIFSLILTAVIIIAVIALIRKHRENRKEKGGKKKKGIFKRNKKEKKEEVKEAETAEVNAQIPETEKEQQ